MPDLADRLSRTTDQLRNSLPTQAFPDPAPFLTEPRGRFQGAGIVVAPGCTDDVSRIMATCHDARVPVVPYGGGTGLVGGQITPTPALILSLHRMNAIRSVDAKGGSMTTEAGAILDDLHTAAAQENRLFPLALASSGSARIGGLLATNAGGVNVLRYGNARALCLGVEAVLPDGRVLNGLTDLRKDNTGYDLRDLLIGSEGTLAVITAATLRLFSRPASIGTAWLAVGSPQAALDLLAMAQGRFGETISAFELIARQGTDFLIETGLETRMPLNPMPDWSVLVELGLPQGIPASQALETLFTEAHNAGLSTDGVIAQSETQRAQLWALRENIPSANRRIGAIASHDISVPIGRVPDFITCATNLLESFAIRINCFGHLGDGNLHFNAFPALGQHRDAYDDSRAQITRIVHDLVADMGGSFSAEHGVGRLKTKDLAHYADPVRLNLMRAIKTAFDPHGIMNPGAVLQSPE